MNMSDLKQIACQAIDQAAEELNQISQSIWRKPELGLQETHAHDVLTNFLEHHGFQVLRSYKMETAFRATFGSNDFGSNIAVMSEYDALPSIGHACGHNLIAEVGVAAGIGIKAAIEAAGKPIGKVTVMGTPAEEGLGGKIDLINAEGFTGIDVAMMAHPFPNNNPVPVTLARESYEVQFNGKASHAAAYPWEGVNALDAAVLCYQSLACLRQQIKPDWRIHCIIKDGGEKVNIIPEKSVIHAAVRAPTDGELRQLRERVISCFTSSATSTGCKVEYRLLNKPYSAMMHNSIMVELYESNMASLPGGGGPSRRSGVYGSTDMGNVSQKIPSIHPNFYIGGVEVNHTRGFTDDAGAARAQFYALQQGKALAMTAIDILTNPEKMKLIKAKFEEDVAKYS